MSMNTRAGLMTLAFYGALAFGHWRWGGPPWWVWTLPLIAPVVAVSIAGAILLLAIILTSMGNALQHWGEEKQASAAQPPNPPHLPRGW